MRSAALVPGRAGGGAGTRGVARGGGGRGCRGHRGSAEAAGGRRAGGAVVRTRGAGPSGQGAGVGGRAVGGAGAGRGRLGEVQGGGRGACGGGVGAGARRRFLRLRGALRPCSAPGRWEEGPPGRLAGRGAARRGPARPACTAQNGRRGPASGPPSPQAAGGAGRGLTCRPSPSGTARSRPPPGASRVGMDRRDGTVDRKSVV